jgi:tol-pal system protein YbgF
VTPRAGGALAFAALLLVAAPLPGCYTTQLGLLRSGLDSLRTQVDTLTVRDSVAYRVLAETQRELGQQRDLILSTRATSGSTMQELFDHMSRLEGKLDDVMHRFSDWSVRSSAQTGTVSSPPVSPPAGGGTPATAGTQGPVGTGAAATPAGTTTGASPPPATTSGGGDPTVAYDQATRDLTEGRYVLALNGYRDFLRKYPTLELADNAQYGVAECFFAQAAFDSAATEYGKVGDRWPRGDRVPAALYKLGLCQDRLGRAADAKKTFEDLVKRFPGASEAALARDRLGASKR